MIEGKKLVLAFHDDLGISGGSKIDACLRELAVLKEKPGFAGLLENLTVLRPNRVHSLRTKTDLNKALEAVGANVDDPERTAIFMFAPYTVGAEFSGVGSSVYPVIINEEYASGKRFNSALNYYPLLEIITISLIKYRTGYPPSKIRRLLDVVGVGDLRDLNIASMKENDTKTRSFLAFRLIPRIDRLDINKGRDLYYLLYKTLKTAA